MQDLYQHKLDFCRKPKVTRKVTEDEDPKSVEIDSNTDAFNSFDYIESMLGTAKPSSPETTDITYTRSETTVIPYIEDNEDDEAQTNGNSKQSSDDKAFVIPEGKFLRVFTLQL